MICQSQSHGRRSLLIAMYVVRHPKRLAQSEMRPMEMVIEDLQANEGIPGRIAFGKGMRFARQRIESITQHPIEPFQVHGSGRSNTAAHGGPDLDRQEASMLIMMLDRLRQRHRVRDDQCASSPSAMTRLGLTIGMLQDARIVFPAIAVPGKWAMVASLNRRAHRLADQVLTERTGGVSSHEATVAILDHATPAFSFVRLLPCPFFFEQTTRTHQFPPG